MPGPTALGENSGFGSLLMAVVRNTRLPHTIGLECASPGIDVFQGMFTDVRESHTVGRDCTSATPDAFGPRNEGQF